MRIWDCTGIRMAAALAIFIVVQGPSRADNVMPKALDPSEDAALMKLAAAVRQSDYGRCVELAQQRPEWRYTPLVQMNIAFALLARKDYSGCAAVSQQMISTYQGADPDIAAWAKYYSARCLTHEKDYSQAATAYLDVLDSYASLGDMMPVLNAQRNLGMLLSFGRISDKDLVSISAERASSKTLRFMALCSKKAERGDLEGAYWYIDVLRQSLPHSDKRIAIAVTGLVMSASYYFDRRPARYAEKVMKCEPLLSEIEQSCPDERWLICRAKLTFASAIMRGRIDLPKAERYIREVIDEGTVTDLLPEAHSLLGNVLYAQGKYQEAAMAAASVARLFPYSSWVDFASFLNAESIYKSGNKTTALTLLDEVTNRYPNIHRLASAGRLV